MNIQDVAVTLGPAPTGIFGSIDPYAKYYPDKPMSLYQVNKVLLTQYSLIKINANLEEEIKKLSKKEFLKKFFNVYNVTKGTVFVKTGEQQAGVNKRRSLGDLVMLVKHYFGKTSIVEVKRLLDELISEEQLSSLRCPHIHRRVWYGRSHDMSCGMRHDMKLRDEFGWFYENYLKC